MGTGEVLLRPLTPRPGEGGLHTAPTLLGCSSVCQAPSQMRELTLPAKTHLSLWTSDEAGIPYPDPSYPREENPQIPFTLVHKYYGMKTINDSNTSEYKICYESCAPARWLVKFDETAGSSVLFQTKISGSLLAFSLVTSYSLSVLGHNYSTCAVLIFWSLLF